MVGGLVGGEQSGEAGQMFGGSKRQHMGCYFETHFQQSPPWRKIQSAASECALGAFKLERC